MLDNKLTSVSLPNNITEIPDGAFYCCTNITSITIPDTVTRIGNNAFLQCPLHTLTIPQNVTFIGEKAFLASRYFNQIRYHGTTEQWLAITKGEKWDYNTQEYTICCSNGTLDKL